MPSVLANTSLPVLFAAGLALAMTAVAIFTWFYHDTKHRDLDDWVDFGFSRDTLRHALLYYRFMAVSMAVFYVLFVVSCLMLQSDGVLIFLEKRQSAVGGPIGTSLFALDLVLRGGFFDIMEHFDFSVTTLEMNRANRAFVWYCFVFRMYYGLSLIKIAISFAWIWTKIRLARKAERERQAAPAVIGGGGQGN